MCGINDDPSMHDISRVKENPMPLVEMERAIKQLSELLQDSSYNTVPVKEIRVVNDGFHSWKAYAILEDEKPFMYAIYFSDEYPAIADGY